MAAISLRRKVCPSHWRGSRAPNYLASTGDKRSSLAGKASVNIAAAKSL